MIFGFFGKVPSPHDAAAAIIHAAIVAQSRQTAFYRAFGAPDTLPGRFEMIVLHAALAFRRLRAEGADEARAIGQEAFDAMFRSLDAGMRESGVGDLTVPKRIKAMARSFYDGAATYDAALDASDPDALEGALRRIVYRGAPPAGDGPSRLAAYVFAAEQALADQPLQSLVTNGPAFPSAAEEAAT